MPKNLAQRIIRAIQSAFIDILLVRLCPLILFFSSFGKAAAIEGIEIIDGVAWIVGVLGFFLGWLLGFFAVGGKSEDGIAAPSGRLAVRNGFEVWIGAPRYGFDPPPLLIKLVDVVGLDFPKRFDLPDEIWAALCIVLVAAVAVITLSPRLAGHFNPSVATSTARRFCFWISFAALLMVDARVWAINALERLRTSPDLSHRAELLPQAS